MIRRTPQAINPNPLSPAEIDLAHDAAQKVVQTHRRLVDWLRVGLTLAQIDQFVARTLDDLNCKSCFLGYRVQRSPAFPSHACLSLNDCIVHGTAGYTAKPMVEGDVLKIDIGVIHRGWIGDAAWTYVFKTFPSDQVRALVACGRESLTRGIAQLQPGNLLVNWAQAVQKHAESECGFYLIRGLGGHGYGRTLHRPPFVANTVPTYAGEWPDALMPLRPGMMLAVEPMIAIGGGGEVRQKPREWPVFTPDGSIAVHHEHDVLITEAGPRILSEGMDDLPDVVG